MAEYKNIPVDHETYEMVKALAKRNWRGLGAQVRVMAEAEVKRLAAEDKKAQPVGSVSEPVAKPAKA